jgi:hypothetical protein
MVENNTNEREDRTFNDLITDRLNSIKIENGIEILQKEKLGIYAETKPEEIFARCIIHQVYPEENLEIIKLEDLRKILNTITNCLNGDCKDTILSKFEEQNPNKRDINNFSTRIKTNLNLENSTEHVIEDIISYSVISSFNREHFFNANRRIFLGESPTEVLEEICNG